MSFTYGGSWVDICNRALSRLGLGVIQSLTSEVANRENARYCQMHLGEAIEDVYGSFPFRSGIKIKDLSALVETPPDWPNAFQMPGGVIRIVEVVADGEWEIRGDTIATESTRVILSYIGRPEDPAKIPGYIRRAISTKLAFLLSSALASNEELIARLAAETREAIEAAKTIEQAGEPDRDVQRWYDEVR